MKKNKTMDIFMYAVLFLLPFLYVRSGINLSDQGYNLANFESFPNMNQTWAIATLAANVVGKIFTWLPFGHYMLGMNVYCTLLLSVTSVIIFYVLKKEYSKYALFVGAVIAICLSWSVKVTLYQYLSYYLFSLSVVVLIQGLVQNRRWQLWGAGLILGISLFVRFPNITQAALIVVVIYAGILGKKSFREVIMDCLVCVAGYLMIAVTVILLVELFFGNGAYRDMISNLFAMTDTAVVYKPSSMVLAVYKGYFENWRWIRYFLVQAAGGVLIYGFLRSKKCKWIFCAFMGLIFLFILRVYWYWGVMNIRYTKYDSIVIWGVCFLVLSIIVMCCKICFPGSSSKAKLYALSVLVIILITPLGGNNALYYNYNNLYLVAPLTMGMLAEMLHGAWKKEKEQQGKDKIWRFSSMPLLLVSGMVTGMVLLQSFLFRSFFIYGEQEGARAQRYQVTGNKVLAGMLTNQTTARELIGLQEFIADNDLKRRETIVWAHSPMLYYAMELSCAIGHTWPSLDSYPIASLEQDLNNMEVYPMIIYQAQYYEDLIRKSPDGDKKAYLITEILQEGNYQEVYRNEYYAVCLPEDDNKDMGEDNQ